MSSITYDARRPIKVFPLESGLFPTRLVRRYGHTWMRLVLIASDGLSLLAAVALGGLIVGQFSPDFYLRYMPLGFVFIAISSARGLYPAVGMGAEKELRSLTIAVCIAFLTLGSFSFLFNDPQAYSRPTVLMSWIIAIILVPVSRHLARWILARLDLWGEAVAVIGPLNDSLKIVTDLRKRRRIGRRPVVVFTEEDVHMRFNHAVPLLSVEHIADFCARYHVSTALVVHPDLYSIDTVREKYSDYFQRVQLVNPSDQGLRLSGVSVTEFGGALSLEMHHTLMDRGEQLQKRAVDIVVSFVMLVALLPLLGFVGLLIKLDSPGPILYYQPRMGKGGRKFKLFKFRTMRVDADQVLKTYLEKDPVMKAEWDQYQKLSKDPRITRVGAWLRRFSIDELPQLWNVLVGDMSLVGPRPIMLDQAEPYGTNLDNYKRVLPGISGMWQINGRNHTTFARRAELDYQYVLTWSFWLDIYILARTIWVVIRREGAS